MQRLQVSFITAFSRRKIWKYEKVNLMICHTQIREKIRKYCLSSHYHIEIDVCQYDETFDGATGPFLFSTTETLVFIRTILYFRFFIIIKF